MSVLWAVAGLLAAFLLPLLRQEVWGWCPVLARRLVRFAACFVPFEQRRRYREEWLAEVEAFEGRHLSMVAMAVWILLFAPGTGFAYLRLRMPHRAPAPTGTGADRSAAARALALWAVTRRATDLARQAAPRYRSRVQPSAADVLTGQDAVIPVDRFVAYLEDTERAFAADSPLDMLSRIRNTYYSGFLVEQLLPDTNASGEITLHGNPNLGRAAYRHLTARADENGVGDNPAPYLLLPSGEQVDVGHLFLGLDALVHPRTSVPFSAYGVPNIDATGWVADVGMASVWTARHHEGDPDPRASRRLPVADREAYYRMSAPEADLLGDVDVFALRASWGLGTGRPRPLSDVLRGYYLGSGRRPAGMRWRWRAFTAANHLGWARTMNGVTWDPAGWDGWVRRIDRFNDVYGAGVGGSLWGTLTRPVHRAWPDTPYMLTVFLGWASHLLEVELTTWA